MDNVWKVCSVPECLKHVETELMLRYTSLQGDSGAMQETSGKQVSV